MLKQTEERRVTLQWQAQAVESRITKKTFLIIGTAIFLLFVVCMASGRYSISPRELLPAVLHGILDAVIFFLEIPAKLIPFVQYQILNPIPQTWDATVDVVLWTIRLPRVIGAFLVGGGLSVTGANYQGVFQNPLVSDNILGVSAGAGFGAALAIALDFSGSFIGFFAFIGAASAVLITYLTSRVFSGNPTLLLVLTGTVVSSLFSAFLSIIQYLVPTDTKLPAIVFWLMGSFTRIDASGLSVMAPVILIGSYLLYCMRWRLNILSLGDSMAHSMGINVSRTRLLIIALSTLISAITVCYCGIVGWVGVVVPQMTRMIIGPDNRRLIPTSFFIGAIFMMLIDLICRTVTSAELPVGIITSIVGAPIYLGLLNRVRKGWL